MLFHYSDDIVKAPVHNTVTLINEYIELDQDDTIQDFHGELVASELVESIQNDELIKEKFGVEFVDRIIKSIKNNPKETIYYLYGILSLSIQDVLVDTRLLVEMKKDSFNIQEKIEEKDIRTLFERTFQCERKQERN